MPRIKRNKILANKLRCFNQIVSELENLDEFDGYDFNTIEISVRFQAPPPRISSKKLIQAINTISSHIGNNCKKPFDYLTTHVGLSKITGINRQTIYRWFNVGLIIKGTKREVFGEKDSYIDLEIVLEQLKKLKK